MLEPGIEGCSLSISPVLAATKLLQKCLAEVLQCICQAGYSVHLQSETLLCPSMINNFQGCSV